MNDSNPSGFPVMSAHVVTVVNSTLFVLLCFMFAFAMAHLFRLYVREYRVSSPLAKSRHLNAVWRMYRFSKPSIAIVTIIWSMWARVGILAHSGYVQIHHSPVDWLTTWTLECYLFVNLVFIVGVTCWIRNISPLPITNLQWLVILACAFGFGAMTGI